MQDVANTILDKAGTIKGSELLAKLKEAVPDSKVSPGYASVMLNKWKHARGHIKSGGKTAKKAKAGRQARATAPATSNLMHTLRRVRL